MKRGGDRVGSPVAFVAAGGGGIPSGYSTIYLTSRIGNQSPSLQSTKAAEWGYPFDNSGAGRGGIIVDEIAHETNYDGTHKNWEYVIKNYLGDDIAAKVQEDPERYYLVLEDVAWHKVFTGSAAGSYAIASSSGWAKLEAASGMNPTGDGHTGWCLG